MNTEPEQMLETRLDLERSRRQEHTLRVESEALLEGLRGITEARETATLFRLPRHPENRTAPPGSRSLFSTVS